MWNSGQSKGPPETFANCYQFSFLQTQSMGFQEELALLAPLSRHRDFPLLQRRRQTPAPVILVSVGAGGRATIYNCFLTHKSLFY